MSEFVQRSMRLIAIGMCLSTFCVAHAQEESAAIAEETAPSTPPSQEEIAIDISEDMPEDVEDVSSLTDHSELLPTRYSLTLRGLQLGKMEVRHSSSDTEYFMEAKFHTTGLAGALFNIKIDAQSSGAATSSGVFLPSKATVDINKDGDESHQTMNFIEGLLTNLATDPPIRTTLEPEKHQGAVDPLTALAYVMRPLPFDRLCKINVRIFDGIKATRVALNQPSQRTDGRFQCQGGFAREEGYSAEQIDDEGANFYFTSLYRVDRESGDMIIDRIVGESLYGQFQIIRD